ncbi:hypothetical protein SAMN05216207_101232 [Pseudonocardia ammonioxydans]|uniref:Uncharacterized protein n=1 Tax=Pseudonocardia ammonioxydans TaxID=260086 RepID=A0A1I4XWQ9_PSUAM|nr:hypothetical protein [Pseudonocardia ammonioxydans]SFN30215.1 hypothetical protein SAMN05216207_101232 [Pseudonocardia ammonioxydans]
MGSVGVLLLITIIGALICAKARSAGGAVVFSLLALVLFLATPVGAGLPGAVSTFVSAFDRAATPALNDTQPAQTGPAVAENGGGDR